MKILVNIFHPEINQSVANKTWLEKLKEHPEITTRLLYSDYPDWKINIQKEQNLLTSHDRIVFQHPFYWYSCPPLMKKWLDEVLTYDWAYGPNGNKLAGKEWISAITTGSPARAYQSGSYNNFSISELLKPFQQTANLIQMTFLPAYLLQGTAKLTPDALALSAENYLSYIKNPKPMTTRN